MSIAPYKLKDETWGCQVEPPQDLEEGMVVTVETRKSGAYRAVIKRKLWGNDEKELYSCTRLPDIKAGHCPMCGQPVAHAEQQLAAATQELAAAKQRPAATPVNGAAKEELDDDIPF